MLAQLMVLARAAHAAAGGGSRRPTRGGSSDLDARRNQPDLRAGPGSRGSYRRRAAHRAQRRAPARGADWMACGASPRSPAREREAAVGHLRALAATPKAGAPHSPLSSRMPNGWSRGAGHRGRRRLAEVATPWRFVPWPKTAGIADDILRGSPC
jgi:hypothetical protein